MSIPLLLIWDNPPPIKDSPWLTCPPIDPYLPVHQSVYCFLFSDINPALIFPFPHTELNVGGTEMFVISDREDIVLSDLTKWLSFSDNQYKICTFLWWLTRLQWKYFIFRSGSVFIRFCSQQNNEILCSHNTKTKMSLVDTIHGIAYFVILNDAKFK